MTTVTASFSSYHLLSISWQIHHMNLLPGASRHSVGWKGGKKKNTTTQNCCSAVQHMVESRGKTWMDDLEHTFQSSDVTSLLLGTSWPPSRIQWRRTSWVELELLFSLRFQILAVESPELNRTQVQQEGFNRQLKYKLSALVLM